MLSEVLETAETQTSVSLQGLFVDIIFQTMQFQVFLSINVIGLPDGGGISGSIIENIEAIINFIKYIYFIDAYVAGN